MWLYENICKTACKQGHGNVGKLWTQALRGLGVRGVKGWVGLPREGFPEQRVWTGLERDRFPWGRACREAAGTSRPSDSIPQPCPRALAL